MCFRRVPFLQPADTHWVGTFNCSHLSLSQSGMHCDNTRNTVVVRWLPLQPTVARQSWEATQGKGTGQATVLLSPVPAF